jgi:hypothetical protein
MTDRFKDLFGEERATLVAQMKEYIHQLEAIARAHRLTPSLVSEVAAREAVIEARLRGLPSIQA